MDLIAFKNVKSKFIAMALLGYECPICGKIYIKRKSMVTHLRKHNKNLKLSNCRRISLRTGEYIEIKAEEE
ncbi:MULTISPECIES: C2H2-type zinc finger protein [Bacteria]|uniref:C2H2-finger transcriptional regulator n=3 Tax=root TaxID=1 RepID=A0A1B3SN18_9VIRU|nr:hypothetical protein [Sulfolobus islandicus]YP_009272972.1 C2H2-finger transcriptional regulator [Sulfolobus islandicus rudivirus 3]AOG61580.1 C2H2-finger transcriptional regulator [Sulfolobus islandicus rod-shaped virus 3]